MEEMWLVRDKDMTLGLAIGEKPIKQKIMWTVSRHTDFIELDSSLFPEIQWSDEEPTKVKLIINNG